MKTIQLWAKEITEAAKRRGPVAVENLLRQFKAEWDSSADEPSPPKKHEYTYGTKPEGWRFLALGERIERGDMTYHVTDSTYIPCYSSVGRLVGENQTHYYIRKNP